MTQEWAYWASKAKWANCSCRLPRGRKREADRSEKKDSSQNSWADRLAAETEEKMSWCDFGPDASEEFKKLIAEQAEMESSKICATDLFLKFDSKIKNRNPSLKHFQIT
jgi:hypothetical protein